MEDATTRRPRLMLLQDSDLELERTPRHQCSQYASGGAQYLVGQEGRDFDAKSFRELLIDLRGISGFERLDVFLRQHLGAQNLDAPAATNEPTKGGPSYDEGRALEIANGPV